MAPSCGPFIPIAEDYQGNIWFSTARTGLFQYDGQKFQRIMHYGK
ncbi:MAG: hypothetical protein R2778_10410 [Saprospiraceae bacterium]